MNIQRGRPQGIQARMKAALQAMFAKTGTKTCYKYYTVKVTSGRHEIYNYTDLLQNTHSSRTTGGMFIRMCELVLINVI